MIKIDEVHENLEQQENPGADEQELDENVTAETNDRTEDQITDDEQEESTGADDAEITDQDDDITNEQADPDQREEVDAAEFQLENQKGIIEALIFASSETISLTQLAKISNLNKTSVEDIINELNDDYLETRRSFRIENVAGGYRMFTLPEFHSFINQSGIIERTQKLSQAALESLAVIAYKQPITRAEIERIRGVDCGGVLKNLMSKNLILLDGRSPAPGKPILYRTSDYFLEYFGLPSLDHLPPLSEIEDHGELPKLTLIKLGEDKNAEAEPDEVPTDEAEETVAESGEEETQLVDNQELQEVTVEEDFNPDN